MVKRVLVLGGYGNFGRFICQELSRDSNIQLLVAGRSMKKAKAFAECLPTSNAPSPLQLDISSGIEQALQTIQPDIVVNTVGPFQGQSYHVPQACLSAGCHYIDLADGRDFVAGIGILDESAKNKEISIITGASSVPALSAAVLDHYQNQFSGLESVEYGISTAQHTTRGLATTQAVLSYAGKPINTLIKGHLCQVVGWQGLRSYRFNGLGRRWLACCDVPDLAIFPERYPELKTIRFYAGLELPLQQLGVWGLSWLVRMGIIKNLANWSKVLLKTSSLFDRFGGEESGFFMEIKGQGNAGSAETTSFEIVARSGHGPLIPCMPAILLVKRFAAGERFAPGAYPCIGMIDLKTYLTELKTLDIIWTDDQIL